MSAKSNIPPTSFAQWVLKDQENRWWHILSALYLVIAFVWMKVHYPHPNFIPDSYSYLDAAFSNQEVNMWPIGYSAFLRIFSSFTRSDTAQVFIQYFLLQASTYYLLLTVSYLFKPGKWLSRIVLLLCIGNPLPLFLSNYITSDALFAALSLTWFTQLLWILHRPSHRLLITHAIIVFLAFAVRFNALYYPLVSIGVIALTRMPATRKLLALGFTLLLTGGFITHNLYRYKILTGVAQFSPFSGWQLAANALYAYAHVSLPPKIENVPKELRPLQAVVSRHMDSIKSLPYQPDTELGIYYLWDERAPLKEYLREKWMRDSTTDGFKKWASMGPLYAAFGKWIVQTYPVAFVQYYLWPNTLKYYQPSVEFLNIYNMGKDSIDDFAKKWFHLKSNKVSASSKTIASMNVYPTLTAIVNPLFILSFLYFWLTSGFKKSDKGLSVAILLTGIIWVTNFSFSVLASPIVLRYQVFPIVTTFVFLGVLGKYIIKVPQFNIDNNKLLTMKNTSWVLLLLILVGCTPSLPKTGMEGKVLPSFTLQLADSTTTINTVDIPAGAPIIFLFFGPYCPECRVEMKEITANLKKLHNIRLFAITGYPYKDMKTFYTHLNLKKYPNITVGVDTSNYFLKYFNITQVPYIAIYNNQKRLKQVLTGISDPALLERIAFE